ncbi:MAG: SMC-Scp complex subunit ScpB [Acidobacteria bacterium]|nr:SMC-Scp complex subunit ScpB [Acidobacteriota bacterium]
MERNEIRSAIEAIMLASSEPVSPTELSTTLEIPQGDVDEQLSEIEKNLDQSVGGFILERVAGGVRLATRPEFDEQLRRFFSRKRENRMSIAALETLAIVAYRQPITGPEVSELRGVNTSGVLRTLLERRMIRIAGRKNVVGSPFLYRTTKDFLLHFGLERVQDLPKLEEFGEILGEQISDELGLGLGDLAAADAAAAAELDEAAAEAAEERADREEGEPSKDADEPSTDHDESADHDGGPDHAGVPEVGTDDDAPERTDRPEETVAGEETVAAEEER